MRRATTAVIATLALVGLVASLVAGGCGDNGGGAGASVESGSIAAVGDAQVTKADFQQLMTQAQTQMKASGMTVPEAGSPTYNHYVSQIVSYLVQEQVVAQSAEQLGVKVTDSEVADQVAQIEKSYGGEKKVLSLLKQQGMTMDLLKRSIRDQKLAQLAAAIVTKAAAVSDQEIRSHWDAHKSEYQKQKKTSTLAKAESTIKQTLLSAKKEQLWNAWIAKREKALGVAYAAGYDPAKLLASASPSASGSATP